MALKFKEKTYHMNPVKLVDIKDLRGADYNPRVTISARLERVVESLQFLGYLMPLYVNTRGTLLSGHQRIKASQIIGYTKIPVAVYDDGDDVGFEKELNVLFNRATNDMTENENSHELFKEFVETTDPTILTGVQEIAPDTLYPCMKTVIRDAKEMFAGIDLDEGRTLYKYAKQLVRRGIHLPIIVSGDRILNGLSRVKALIHYGYTQVECVEVPEALADYAYNALNFLAMDFNLMEDFEKELKYKSYRRISTSAGIVGFSRTFGYFAMGRTVRNSGGLHDTNDLNLLPHLDKEIKRKYREAFGDVVMDFGCGTYHDVGLLRKAGFKCLAFEPYTIKPGETEPDADYSREKAGKFLDDLEHCWKNGISINSIVSSYTMNSIPHHKSRMAVLCILAAMSGMETTVFLGTKVVARVPYNLNPNMEPNMTFGFSANGFKAQKFFIKDEVASMCRVFWVTVKEIIHDQVIYVECKNPRRINPNILAESLVEEFDLPYEDGTTMGLVDRVRGLFERYRGVTFPK